LKALGIRQNQFENFNPLVIENVHSLVEVSDHFEDVERAFKSYPRVFDDFKILDDDSVSPQIVETVRNLLRLYLKTVNLARLGTVNQLKRHPAG
jgi:hypothetical protein